MQHNAVNLFYSKKQDVVVTNIVARAILHQGHIHADGETTQLSHAMYECGRKCDQSCVKPTNITAGAAMRLRSQICAIRVLATHLKKSRRHLFESHNRAKHKRRGAFKVRNSVHSEIEIARMKINELAGETEVYKNLRVYRPATLDE